MHGMLLNTISLGPFLHEGRVPRLTGLKHSPPLHATHLSEIVVTITAAFQCLGLLFCTLLIERIHQRQLTLKAALENNATSHLG